MMRSAIPAIIALAFAPVAFAQSAPAAPDDSCACVPAFNDPSVSPFSVGGTALSGVEPYKVTESNGKRTHTWLAGAVVYVRPTAGVTPELLQRALERHRSYLVANDLRAPDSPLALQHVSVTTESTGDGFAVTLASNDRKTAHEILRRAEGLVSY
jgi:hypothetical protein